MAQQTSNQDVSRPLPLTVLPEPSQAAPHRVKPLLAPIEHQLTSLPSQPLANIITQVSPTGHQPGRAPARPARARPAAKGKNKQSKPQPNPESASQSASVAPSQTPITPIQHSAAASPEDKRIPSSQDSSVEDGSRLSNPHDASSTLVEAPAAPDAAIRDAEKTPQTYPPTSSAPQPASAAPAAPSNQNTNPTSTNQPKKGPQSTKGRKKKSGPSPWTSFLIALGCVSKRAYDDPEQQTDSASSTKPSGQPLKRTRSAEKHDANLHENSKQTSSSPSSSSSPSAQPAVPATEVTPPSPAHDVPQQTQLPGPSTAGSASDRGFASASQRPDHSSSDLPVTPAEPSVSSAPSTSGIPLPKEETGNVTSGAVVPPGADGHSHHATPKKRRSKSSTRTTDSFEDEQQAADLSSEGEDLAGADSEEDDESMFQQDDEEERIIQAGGMGIPVDEVCFYTLPTFSPCVLTLKKIRMEYRGPCWRRWPTTTLAENVSS